MSRGANSSGRIPPSAISQCQPNWGISHDAENPPAAAPKVKPLAEVKAQVSDIVKHNKAEQQAASPPRLCVR